ncbi:uncharacterized protein ACO6RY_03115 [Pungitius sinensis]
MKVLLVVAVMFALLHLGENQPCKSPRYHQAYDDFVRKHILHPENVPGLDEDFDRADKASWQKYIDKKKLCDKKSTKIRTVQSFLEKEHQEEVVAICRGGGTRVISIKPTPKEDRNNYCISNEEINVHILEINKNCKVTQAAKERKRVIVACDLVGAQCRPVHFQWYKTQSSSDKKCSGGLIPVVV